MPPRKPEVVGQILSALVWRRLTFVKTKRVYRWLRWQPLQSPARWRIVAGRGQAIRERQPLHPVDSGKCAVCCSRKRATYAADTVYLRLVIAALSQHKHYFTTRTSEVVFARYLDGRSGAGNEKVEGLTPREREIVQLLAEGKGNKQAATVLGISAKTVETHRATIMRKLRVGSFAELVRYAVRSRIVTA
ncbi:MAG: response regulator transcription factor [Chthoniobacterales bacterium]|nr:response regulator transcription factor [Chthoniobacterales bacterium]